VQREWLDEGLFLSAHPGFSHQAYQDTPEPILLMMRALDHKRAQAIKRRGK